MKFNKVLTALAAAASLSAVAAPAISLPEGPLFIKFENREQIGLNGATTWAGSQEFNWGVLRVSSMELGDIVAANDQIGGSGSQFFNNAGAVGFNGSHNARVTGIFYDIQPFTGPGSPQAGNLFPATGGYMDLYWNDLDGLNATDRGAIGNLTAGVVPASRTAQDQYTGFTDGIFLARILFASGIDTNSGVNISGSVVPTTGIFNGFAESYGNIDVSAGGLWAEALDGNWFDTPFGQRDMRFKNSYSNLANWDGSCQSATGPCVLGAKSDDPAQAFAIPEPTTLALVGLSLFGIGLARRRKSL